jgi:hemoglobin
MSKPRQCMKVVRRKRIQRLEISANIAEVYGASVSRGTVSKITDHVLEEMGACSTTFLRCPYVADESRFVGHVRYSEGQDTMRDQPSGGGLSDYDLVGGGTAISAVVNNFYERVLRDPQLAQYFDGVDLARLKRHQGLLISQVLGGPADYNGRPLDQAHAGLGISHDDLAAVVSHLVAAMREARVPEDILLRTIAVVASTEPDIVESRSP